MQAIARSVTLRIPETADKTMETILADEETLPDTDRTAERRTDDKRSDKVRLSRRHPDRPPEDFLEQSMFFRLLSSAPRQFGALL